MLGLKISIAYSDEHLNEIEVFVANGRLSAHTEAYVGTKTLTETAAVISDVKNGEVREFLFGDNVQITMAAADSIGHVDVGAVLRGTWTSEDRAEIHFETSLGEVDEFAAQLIHLESKRSGSAILLKT